MGYPLGKESLCSTHHQSPKAILPKRYGLRSTEGDYGTNNHLQQQRHQVLHRDVNCLKNNQTQRTQSFTLPAPRSTRIDLIPACSQNTRQSTPFLTEDQNSLMEDSDRLFPGPLEASPSSSSHSGQQHPFLFDASAPPTVISTTLFSDDPTWVGGMPGKEYIWAPDNKESLWGPLGVAEGVSRPQPVTPVGEIANPLDSRNGTTVQSLFVSLTREPSDSLTTDVPQSTTALPCSQKNIVDIIMAQLTDSSYGNNSNDDSIGSHTYEAPSTVLSTLPKAPTYPMEELTIPCLTSLCGIETLLDSRTASYDDLLDYHREQESIHEPLMRCEAPLAVGCTPPSSARKKENEDDIIPYHRGQNSSDTNTATTPDVSSNRGNNSKKLANDRRNSDRRTNQLTQLSLNIPLMPVVDITTLSNLHRSTSHALHVKAMIKKSHPGPLLKAVEWPPRTSDDVVSLLKQYRAKELLRHLRVVSFARKNAECVRELFESWCAKGIPPSDVLFGAYYLYVMKRGNRELCLKHNGRGRVMGHGRGCDYALKGPSFRCRYRHVCLFCSAGDHGWFDEEYCERYLNLQKEMIQLGVTDSVGLVLLDALEYDDHSNLLGDIK
ncbi:uncharacterized protein TM35_000032580 [Trypanosoma theileri]|uniref:Uncharacterized protein n=1 Tax=Trypanosoma theileri TaxID=67003 RepID=A0A1X0P6L6_9TRYP|nr:uncharacterized protein TM35_000032580 [Trypanosoma theileri]ORC92505.1 hypothetical protein TM35_000032580 [Trypanosoma theileri]